MRKWIPCGSNADEGTRWVLPGVFNIPSWTGKQHWGWRENAYWIASESFIHGPATGRARRSTSLRGSVKASPGKNNRPAMKYPVFCCGGSEGSIVACSVPTPLARVYYKHWGIYFQRNRMCRTVSDVQCYLTSSLEYLCVLPLGHLKTLP